MKMKPKTRCEAIRPVYLTPPQMKCIMYYPEGSVYLMNDGSLWTCSDELYWGKVECVHYWEYNEDHQCIDEHSNVVEAEYFIHPDAPVDYDFCGEADDMSCYLYFKYEEE